MLADAEPLRHLSYRITPFGDLSHRITLELIAEIGLPHRRLLSSKLGSKASRNLGATQSTFANQANSWRSDVKRLMRMMPKVSLSLAD